MCRNKTSWAGFGSIPPTTAIFVKIGDGPVPPGLDIGYSLVHALLSSSTISPASDDLWSGGIAQPKIRVNNGPHFAPLVKYDKWTERKEETRRDGLR